MQKKSFLLAVAALCVGGSQVALAKDVRPAAVNFQPSTAAQAPVDAAPARVRVAKHHDFLGLGTVPLLLVVGGIGLTAGVIAATTGGSPS